MTLAAAVKWKQVPGICEAPPVALRRHAYLALVVAIVCACLYVGLIVAIDNTNLGTTNGLAKAPAVAGWEHGTGAQVDSGGILYHKTYGLLARLIPDSLVQYGGVRTRFLTFRKMAILNGVFGGAASGCFFPAGPDIYELPRTVSPRRPHPRRRGVRASK